MFFPFGTIPAMPRYPEFTDRFSPQYGRLSFSLNFMTHTFFRLSFPHFHLFSQSQGWSNYMHDTIPDPTDIFLVVLPPPSPSHSSDLGYARTQRIMFLGRLIQSTHLMSGEPRPATIWLTLYLSRKGCLDSEN